MIFNGEHNFQILHGWISFVTFTLKTHRLKLFYHTHLKTSNLASVPEFSMIDGLSV